MISPRVRPDDVARLTVAHRAALHRLVVDMELTPSTGVSTEVGSQVIGRECRDGPDDEIIVLRSRLDRLQRSLRFIDEPVATALIKGVITDMEARIDAVESNRQQQAGKGVKMP